MRNLASHSSTYSTLLYHSSCCFSSICYYYCWLLPPGLPTHQSKSPRCCSEAEDWLQASMSPHNFDPYRKNGFFRLGTAFPPADLKTKMIFICRHMKSTQSQRNVPRRLNSQPNYWPRSMRLHFGVCVYRLSITSMVFRCTISFNQAFQWKLIESNSFNIISTSVKRHI